MAATSGYDRIRNLQNAYTSSVLTKASDLDSIKSEINELYNVLRMEYERDVFEVQKLEAKIDQQIKFSQAQVVVLRERLGDLDKKLSKAIKKSKLVPSRLQPTAAEARTKPQRGWWGGSCAGKQTDKRCEAVGSPFVDELLEEEEEGETGVQSRDIAGLQA